MKICAITNVYNESFNLPVWLNYYGSQFGIENCTVIDNGTTDGSTKDLKGAGRVNMPREGFSDTRRAQFISEFASSMLSLYDAVIYTDCDEILVVDPDKYSSLHSYISQMPEPWITTIGLNLVHYLPTEDALDMSSKILRQRSHVWFVSPMCKPLIISKPIRWSDGFHGSNRYAPVGDVYLIHTRLADLSEYLRRLFTTRRMDLGDAVAAHQRMTSFGGVELFASIARLPVADNLDFSSPIERVMNALAEPQGGFHAVREDIRSEGLHKLPQRFQDLF